MQEWARHPIFWSIVIILLGLTVLTPLQLITVHIAMVPIVMIAALTPKLPMAAVYIAAPAMLLMLLSGPAWPITAIVMAVMFVPGAAMGYMYRRGANAVASITAGVVGMIAVLLAILVSLTLAGINIQAEIRNMIMEQFQLFTQITGNPLISEEALDAAISVAVRLLPLYIMVIAFYYAVITHVIARRLLNKLGIPAKAMPPVREWRLPKSLVWYYLAVLILELFTPVESGLYTLLLNVYPILLITFTVQGLAFYFAWAYYKGRSRALPIAAIVLCLLFPPAMQITSLVGLIDTAFPIRKFANR